jgi:vancomycin resistance protein YoaR
LDDKDIAELSTVYLFKNQQDLEDLWYVVSSYRTRVNTDAAWRKDNIAISYRNIWNVRVINPQQQLSFMDEIHYDASANDWKRDTVSGLAIMWGVTSVKWWGICGASRGINATIITNKAFDIVTRYNHSKTWKHLYQNVINGQEIWLPGMDVAVYRMWWSQKDFVFKNIREYPVVLVMNYDWTSGWTEELFVLSHEEDRGTLQYIGRKGNCFSWEANGEAFRSCYNSVSWR